MGGVYIHAHPDEAGELAAMSGTGARGHLGYRRLRLLGIKEPPPQVYVRGRTIKHCLFGSGLPSLGMMPTIESCKVSR